ncbi:hypothetical protein GIB67_017548 [Kingdonia uniflora]|uniref:Plastocyanin-like domain-containing protein n=1 Tax=Kingdonia uniflora TaxID=39325 RepID=A0A7J7PB84_9MAGN|nr:hypothetical protein GIB67_017548 [Kingdonia uniflora]
MRTENRVLCSLIFFLTFFIAFNVVNGEDPYRFFTWKVTSGPIYPMGIRQQGILINGQFPGPKIDTVTNDNLIISVYNYLTEPFLITCYQFCRSLSAILISLARVARFEWYTTEEEFMAGWSLRHKLPYSAWENFTYALQMKDQIGSFFYFPSLGMHKAAGGFGGINIYSRPRIPVPFPHPAGDFTLLAGDWFKRSPRVLKAILDSGHNLPFPDGLLINGQGWNGNTFTVNQGLGYQMWASDIYKLQDSRTYNEVDRGRRVSYTSEHVHFPGHPSWAILLCVGHC